MMDYRWTLFLIAVVGLVSSQKLYFKSNTILQKEVGQHVSDQVPAGVVVCPDRTSACPDGNTCCMTSTGAYDCCPLSMAVCCSDHVHCCPHGTTCDVSHGKCNRGDSQLDWFVKTPAIEIGDVKCDSTHKCASGHTCCKLLSGRWGCCPLPQAVCCRDHVHCCPHGTICDVSSGKCNRGDSQLDWFVKKPAIEIGDVKCDSTHKSPSGETCCKQRSGQWGCCPLPQGVCCDDHKHCCPHGYICDEEPGICRIQISNTAVSNFMRKIVTRRGFPIA